MALRERARPSPTFIIIGAQRAGTTSLYNYLTQHPAVIAARRKELHFFDRSFHLGIGWYRRQFRKPPLLRIGARLITGESTPYYLFHPLVAERVWQAFPEMKLIALLRNPVDRALSHYHFSVRLGHETLSFEDALAQEADRLAGERERLCTQPGYQSHAYVNFSYQARGMYADQLEMWLRRFPREQLLILRSEDLYRSPSHVLNTVCDFLSLPPCTVEVFERYNHNEYPPMNPATRARLHDSFAPLNRRLHEIAGRDFEWEA